MLNVLFRRAALRARARFIGLATCAWLAWMPMAHAAESQMSSQAASVPFNLYQGWRDDPLQDWREANARVGEIGGWRTYLREAQPGGSPDDSGHAHHGHHGH